jgi:pilus assembly protein CpaD
VAAVLLAGSCAAPSHDGPVFADGLRNHPITVAPHYQSVRVAFSDSTAGLSPEDGTQLASFVEDYLSRGDGAISISAPRGPGSSAALGYFGEQLAHMGVPRNRILVGTHDVADGDTRVEIGYIVYGARADSCGNWTQDASETWDNLPMPDFGCSVQHNIAAMAADPRDLVAPRGMDAGDATRRQTVVGTYEKAQSTASAKSSSQSATLSDVGGGGQ